MLDEDLRQYTGVDLTSTFPEECHNNNVIWERWERMLMGFRTSLYFTTRDMKRLEPHIKGNRFNQENVFSWNQVVMNLPGDKTYDPSKPRVYKVRKDGSIAADLFIYIDDLRPTAPTRLEVWMAAHQVGYKLCWVGLQDAARKR